MRLFLCRLELELELELEFAGKTTIKREDTNLIYVPLPANIAEHAKSRSDADNVN